MTSAAAAANVFEVALSVLEVLRVDLHEWRSSPDQLAAVERGAARREDEAARPTSSLHPAPPFRFRPLATAPATSVDFSPHRPHRNVNRARRPTSGDAAASHVTIEHKASVASSATNATTHSQEAAPKSASPSPPLSETAAPVKFTTATHPAPHLRLTSPVAQRLYADMTERGRAAALAAPTAAAQWRRRTAAPPDAELRRAVRDYLYRMHILSCLDVATDAADGAPDAFADAVMNGAALCQLVSSLLHDGGSSLDPEVDAVPCRCPRTLEEVRVNYAATLAALRTAPASAQERVPPASWSILPEDVYFTAGPSALLQLFLHLVSTYLPSPEELPTWHRHMTWQPPADRPVFAAVSPADLAAAEDACCAFLHAAGVLPDPVLHNLPGPECLLPPAVAAPFMASWKTYAVRTAAPTCLLVPAVWPYVCNGVLLVLLARRSGAEAAARAGGSASVGRFFANPRTAACCMANISTAFCCFQAVSALASSLHFFTAESAAAVLRGDRVHIVSLLLHLRDVLAGKETAPTLQRCCTAARTGAGVHGMESALCRTPERRVPASASLPQTPASTAIRKTSADGTSSSPSRSASTLRRITPATIAKGVMRRSPPPSPSTSEVTPAVHVNPAAVGGIRGAAPSCSSRSPDVVQWLCRLLEPGFHYTAADKSFSVDAHHLVVSEPCWIFADGVVLAHIIRKLECRRCDFLDCVQPAVKKAARLFNVRRCLEFLRSSAGVVWDVPLLDEALVRGSGSGVMSVLLALRGHYGTVNKGAVSHGETRAYVAASAA